MARNIRDALYNVFQWQRSRNYFACRNPQAIDNHVKCIEIPTIGDTFEIPCFAMKAFINRVEGGVPLDSDTMVYFLRSSCCKSSYKSINCVIRDSLEAHVHNGLVKMEAKRGDNTIYFWGTLGAIFSPDYFPMMICSWLIEKEHSYPEEPDRTIYKAIKPIIRISRDAFMAKEDNLTRYVCGKFVEEALNCHFSATNLRHSVDEIPTIEIGDFPFKIKRLAVPSVSTTNEELRQVVLDHINDF